MITTHVTSFFAARTRSSEAFRPGPDTSSRTSSWLLWLRCLRCVAGSWLVSGCCVGITVLWSMWLRVWLLLLLLLVVVVGVVVVGRLLLVMVLVGLPRPLGMHSWRLCGARGAGGGPVGISCLVFV